VHSLLLQKSDGAFYLLLWNDVLVWDGKAFADINNPPVPVTVSFADAVAHADIAAMNADGTYTTLPGALSGSRGHQTLTLAVPDSLMLVKIVRMRR
ncbi:MAG: hypothetical protein M3Y13_09375, partial [Armatimonadota bacterium]|nr:hypothetical protein [Armatimonadota bacterium]